MKSELKNTDELINFLNEVGIKYIFLIDKDLSIEGVIDTSELDKFNVPDQLLFFKKSGDIVIYGYIIKVDARRFRIFIFEKEWDMNTAFHFSLNKKLGFRILSEVV